jgi:hypothetical protein
MHAHSCKTKIGYRAIVNLHPWKRDDFAYLGVVEVNGAFRLPWAWHADGRSIDREDRGFDLVDLSAEAA